MTYSIASTTLMSTACAMVLLRLVHSQLFSVNGLTLDDWFILFTLVVCVPSAVINVQLLSANGLGRDIWTLTPGMISDFARAFWVITILYFSEVFLLKLSLLFFYLRIFPASAIRRMLWGTIAFDIAFGMAFVLTAVFQCWPVSFNWTSWRGEGGGSCANVSAIAWANAAVSITIDLWMLALPLWQLKSLNLAWKKKLGVALMFCVGTL